jgi:cation-transporting ATPase E
VLRDGKELEIPITSIVKGDLLRLRVGDQVAADAVILLCEGLAMNEALLTGEADNVQKQNGDEVLAGSFVTVGAGYAKVVRVGEACFASQIVSEARQASSGDSPLVRSLNRVLKVIGIILIPLGAFLFLSDYRLTDISFRAATTSAVAGMVSLVPQGLLVLTNISLASGVIKMAGHMAFFKSLPSIEIMARLDVLCFDKTGTLSDGHMRVESYIPVGESSLEPLRALMVSMTSDNATSLAIKDYLKEVSWPEGEPNRAETTTAFSSDRKWCGAVFRTREDAWETWVLGAPEVLITDMTMQGIAMKEAEIGRRVLALCHSPQYLPLDTDIGFFRDNLRPMSFLVLTDTVKNGVSEVTHYLQEQGITLKVISGDSAAATAAVAAQCGIAGFEHIVDLSQTRPGAGGFTYATLAENYTIFGRATPYDKRELIRAISMSGKSVGMAGDGVNDVLSLKEANLSIAMSAGSDAAKNIAHVILLNSDFSSLPAILKEGRRIISNIETVATLYLTKTVYSFILTALCLFLPFPYPFLPIHATLIATVTIGIPSAFLAFSGNSNVFRGDFVRDVIVRAIPSGILVAVNILSVQWIGRYYQLPRIEISTLCVMVTAVVAIQVLITVCGRPFHAFNRLIIGGVITIFTLAFAFLQRFFMLWWRPGWPLAAAFAFSVASAFLLRFTRVTWFTLKNRYHKVKGGA